MTIYYVLLLALLSGCTSQNPSGNAEAYSGYRPTRGTYFYVDSRVTFANSSGASGYRGVLEVVSESEVRYRGVGETEWTRVNLSDLRVSALGNGALAQNEPLISYQGGLFDPMTSPPTATSTDRTSTRSWCRVNANGDRYDIVVRAQGTAETPTNAKGFVLVSDSSSTRLLGEVALTSSSISATSRAYAGDGVDLRLEKSGVNITGALVATVNGTALNLSGMNCDDTFISPLPPAIARPAIALAAGDGFSCGVKTGATYCWGRGLGGLVDQSTPTALPVLTSEVTVISAGGDHACAIQSGKVFCWGANGSGQLGNSFLAPQSHPTRTVGLAQASAITAGKRHSCAIEAKRVYCWGANTGGELGLGNQTDFPTPQLVSGLAEEAVSVVAGFTHTCALTVKGEVYCWGDDSLGQLGNGATQQNSTVPQKINGVKFVSLSTSGSATCGVTTFGKAACWGENAYSAVSGDGMASAEIGSPHEIPSIAGALTAISVGPRHTCAIQSGNALCWGTNMAGEMGQATTSSFSAVVTVPDLAGVWAISAGGHTLAHTWSAFKSWGSNFYGQLGDGSTTLRLSPVPFFFP